eukprot:scaffold12756_cov15-Tisochrysis_lutea.AAC.1
MPASSSSHTIPHQALLDFKEETRTHAHTSTSCSKSSFSSSSTRASATACARMSSVAISGGLNIWAEERTCDQGGGEQQLAKLHAQIDKSSSDSRAFQA